MDEEDDLLVEEEPTGKAEKDSDDGEILDNLLDKGKGKYTKLKPEKEEDEEVIDEDEEPELKLEDDEDKEDEEIDVTDNTRNIDLKKIKEKYPDFAKTNDFRELRNAYYREGEYTSIFATVEDAKEAAENNETFTKLNDALVNRGDVSVLLAAVKGASPQAAEKIATGFLDALGKFDSQLYLKAVTPVLKGVAKQIFKEGQKYLARNKESEDGLALVATARNLMQYAFDDPDAAEKDEPKQDNQLSQKETELNNREATLRQERFQDAMQVANRSMEKHLDKQILSGLDPDGKMNEFTRDTLLEKIKNGIYKQLGSDQLHLKKMNSLWKRAEQSGYSRDSLSSLVSAYLERARPIIPTIRNKYKSIALKGKSSDEKEEKSIKIPNSGKSGRAAHNDGKVNLRAVDSRKIDYRHTSDDDIFEGRVKLKA